MPAAREWRVAALVLGLLALVPPGAALLGNAFYVDMFTRIMVFAIAAVSLDLILGFGGMVSFCHAVFLAIGGYAIGILGFYGIDNGWLQIAVTILASGVVALVIGAISLRTTGVHFIMITLAFGQMAYFLGISINTYGGDDGLTIDHHSQFGHWLDLGNANVLYYTVLVVLALTLVLCKRLVAARFGLAIRGTQSNERRMAALGFPTFRYKLTAFVIAGVICGIAGALMANQTLFITPGLAGVTRSGEIIVMVIIGGMATLTGPVIGAVVFLGLEQLISGWSQYTELYLAPVLLLIVLFARGGLFGLFGGWPRRLRNG